jgi:hypothetical protein
VPLLALLIVALIAERVVLFERTICPKPELIVPVAVDQWKSIALVLGCPNLRRRLAAPLKKKASKSPRTTEAEQHTDLLDGQLGSVHKQLSCAGRSETVPPLTKAHLHRPLNNSLDRMSVNL